MHADGETSLLPLFLKLAEKTVLVVGAGSVAERKIESLLEAGARVRRHVRRCGGRSSSTTVGPKRRFAIGPVDLEHLASGRPIRFTLD